MEISAVILAGGRSRRFGQQPKAMAILGGASLLEHVIERLLPQVSTMALSVEQRNPLFNTFSLDQIEDPEPGVQGPLPSLLAALKWLREKNHGQWLQLAPCDTPFLPHDLVGRLAIHVGAQAASGCIPSFRGELQPTCGLWNISLLEKVDAAVKEGMRGFKEFLDANPVSILDWPEPQAGSPNPFFNVNTPAHLREAERSL
ncbi:MAG TPA: molybdenum cofactor guanylyltransferase [Xanthomonadales bacterium]|nr:molybdenum cofactor guanylyltransferase [Xanthomonadales bacterium]